MLIEKDGWRRFTKAGTLLFIFMFFGGCLIAVLFSIPYIASASFSEEDFGIIWLGGVSWLCICLWVERKVTRRIRLKKYSRDASAYFDDERVVWLFPKSKNEYDPYRTKPPPGGL